MIMMMFMKPPKVLYKFLLLFAGISVINCDIQFAAVGLIEDAPKYGTYPHKISNDHYMDPCKACKLFDFLSLGPVFCLVNIVFLYTYFEK